MTSQNPWILLLIAVLPACARSAPPAPPEPVLAALQCAHTVVERHGFLAEAGTDWFPWRLPSSGGFEFTVERGDSLAREFVSVSVISIPTTGGVDARASGSSSWINAGTPIRSTGSAADEVARRVHEECSVAAPAA
jgi:hypothetical protein